MQILNPHSLDFMISNFDKFAIIKLRHKYGDEWWILWRILAKKNIAKKFGIFCKITSTKRLRLSIKKFAKFGGEFF